MVRVPSRAGRTGFAEPRTPIRVLMTRDEELGLYNNDHEAAEEETSDITPAPPPPAYGLWRCSVVSCRSNPDPSEVKSLTPASSQRADPNLIHWQSTEQRGRRQDEAMAMVLARRPRTRPPSYVSSTGMEEAGSVPAPLHASTGSQTRRASMT